MIVKLKSYPAKFEDQVCTGPPQTRGRTTHQCRSYILKTHSRNTVQILMVNFCGDKGV